MTQKGKGFRLRRGQPGEVARPRGLRSRSPARRGRRRAARPTWTQVFGDGLDRARRPSTPSSWRSPPRCRAAPAPTSSRRSIPSGSSTSGSPRGTRSRSPAGWRRRASGRSCAIYSTFLQRAYDNIIHDIAVQHLPVMFCMDRAGLVGEDGQTHMGLYDIAYMLAVPGMTVTAPKDGDELIGLLRTALAHTDGPFCTRYPRDKAPAEPRPAAEIPAVPYGTWEQLRPRQGRRHPGRRHDGAAGAAGGRAARRRRHRLRGGQLPLPQAARPRDAGAAAAGAPRRW